MSIVNLICIILSFIYLYVSCNYVIFGLNTLNTILSMQTIWQHLLVIKHVETFKISTLSGLCEYYFLSPWVYICCTGSCLFNYNEFIRDDSFSKVQSRSCQLKIIGLNIFYTTCGEVLLFLF